ncbi:MAG: hypothetical protein Q4G48_07260 [Bacteroidia bacterium]|nr:hypothetical protein [Bacteroidia bacterium]
MTSDTKVLNEKLELIQWLSTVEDNAIIKKVMQIRNEEVSDWWDSISNAEKDSIEKGIIDADNGNVVPHSEARKQYEKWL